MAGVRCRAWLVHSFERDLERKLALCGIFNLPKLHAGDALRKHRHHGLAAGRHFLDYGARLHFIQAAESLQQEQNEVGGRFRIVVEHKRTIRRTRRRQIREVRFFISALRTYRRRGVGMDSDEGED